MSKNPQLDEATRRIAERMLNMPPKPHDQMKVGKPKAKSDTSAGARKRTKKKAKPV